MAAVETLIRQPAPPAAGLNLDRVRVLTPPASPPARLVALAAPQSVGAEQFRRLAVGLRHVRAQRRLRTVLVTSPAPGEGKSLSAANLAFTLARPGGERVLLLDGDLHRPAVLARLGVKHRTGLADWLEGRAELDQCLARWPELPLWVLPAAKAAGVPLELLQAQPPAQILPMLESHFDWIVLDSPPLLPMADAAHWARAADGVLLVVRAQRTRRADLLRSLRQLEREQWLGVIVNCSRAPDHRYYSHYYPHPGD